MLVRVCDICNKQKDDAKEYFLPSRREHIAQGVYRTLRYDEYIPVKKDVCSECAEEIFKFITIMGEADE